MPRPTAAAALATGAAGLTGTAGLNGGDETIRPPLPRPDGAPPLNSHSTPNVRLSFSCTSAIVTSIITCRDCTSSFRSAWSTSEYSDGVATTSSVFWSLSATTWTFRARATPSPGAPGRCAPGGVGGGRTSTCVGCGAFAVGCAENDGGLTIV